ncbi:MAG: glycosyltransferase family 2 protein [Saprospiraceae bacterium]|nr:glycosyltransferase family 2 protein [Saprospiraceae bacterium]
MDTSLIITTYNWPQALDMVLRSVLRQSVMPDEVVIADDGSTESTAEVIRALRDQFSVPLHHIRQEDEGFRVARVRNLGASKASGRYLIFVDGDMLLHRQFVRSHLALRKPGHFLHGPRVLLSDELARDLLRGKLPPRFGVLQAGVTNRLNMLHSLFLSRLISHRSSSWQSRACNLSLYRDAFEKVNGFNEDFVGWGKEDSELAYRLTLAGIRKVNLRLAGVAYHLGHAQSHERTHSEDLRRNEALLNKVIANGSYWCDNGLTNHLTPAVLKDDA